MSETIPKNQEYRNWFQTAIALVADGEADIGDVQSERLPVNDDRLAECVRLSVFNMAEDEAQQRQPVVRDLQAIDWVALWEEFRYHRGDRPWVSFTQFAGAIAVSEQTPGDWQIRTVKQRLVTLIRDDPEWLAMTAWSQINIDDTQTHELPAKVCPTEVLDHEF